MPKPLIFACIVPSLRLRLSPAHLLPPPTLEWGEGMDSSGRLAREQAAFLQQRPGGRQAAAEGDIGLLRVLLATSRIDTVVEPVRERLVEHVAGLLEGLEGVGI